MIGSAKIRIITAISPSLFATYDIEAGIQGFDVIAERLR